jgi:hypothetical protein
MPKKSVYTNVTPATKELIKARAKDLGLLQQEYILYACMLEAKYWDPNGKISQSNIKILSALFALLKESATIPF